MSDVHHTTAAAATTASTTAAAASSLPLIRALEYAVRGDGGEHKAIIAGSASQHTHHHQTQQAHPYGNHGSGHLAAASRARLSSLYALLQSLTRVGRAVVKGTDSQRRFTSQFGEFCRAAHAAMADWQEALQAVNFAAVTRDDAHGDGRVATPTTLHVRDEQLLRELAAYVAAHTPALGTRYLEHVALATLTRRHGNNSSSSSSSAALSASAHALRRRGHGDAVVDAAALRKRSRGEGSSTGGATMAASSASSAYASRHARQASSRATHNTTHHDPIGAHHTHDGSGCDEDSVGSDKDDAEAAAAVRAAAAERDALGLMDESEVTRAALRTALLQQQQQQQQQDQEQSSRAATATARDAQYACAHEPGMFASRARMTTRQQQQQQRQHSLHNNSNNNNNSSNGGSSGAVTRTTADGVTWYDLRVPTQLLSNIAELTPWLQPWLVAPPFAGVAVERVTVERERRAQYNISSSSSSGGGGGAVAGPAAALGSAALSLRSPVQQPQAGATTAAAAAAADTTTTAVTHAVTTATSSLLPLPIQPLTALDVCLAPSPEELLQRYESREAALAAAARAAASTATTGSHSATAVAASTWSSTAATTAASDTTAPHEQQQQHARRVGGGGGGGNAATATTAAASGRAHRRAFFPSIQTRPHVVVPAALMTSLVHYGISSIEQ